MITGIDPKVDFAFKFVFGQEQNKHLLIHLLNAVLRPEPGGEVREIDLLNPFNDKRTSNDKLSVLDLKARDGKGRFFNVEMQVKDGGDFPKRFLYHGTGLHQRQILEGERYADLKPAVLIGFLDYLQFADRPECHLEFGLREKALHFPMTEDLIFHFFQLPRFTKVPGELETPLDKWLYFLRHGDRIDRDALPEQLREPALLDALGVLEMVTQAELDRQAYEDARTRKLDFNSYVRPLLDAERKEERIETINLLERLLKLPESKFEELQALTLQQLAKRSETLQEDLRNRS